MTSHTLCGDCKEIILKVPFSNNQDSIESYFPSEVSDGIFFFLEMLR